MRAGIADLSDQVGVAAQYLNFGSLLAVMIVVAQQIAHCTGGTALAMAKEFQVHGFSSLP